MEVHAGDSPVNAPVPFWLTACVRLAPPLGRTGKPTEAGDKVITAAQALLADRIRVHGEDRVLANREVLASFCGISRTDKMRWITDYLQTIGFLRVDDEPRDSRGRRRNHLDPTTGKSVPDEFVVRERPPLNYVGPQTFAELRDALKAGPPQGLEELFLSSQVSAGPPRGGPDDTPGPPRGEKTRSHPVPPGEEPLNKDSFLRKEGRKESNGVAPLCGAGDATTDDELTAAVRDLVRRLPWGKAPVGRTPKTLEDANEHLVPAIVTAVREREEFTLEAAANHALARMDRVSSVNFLVNAFVRPKHLSLPEPDDVLSLPPDTPSPARPMRTQASKPSDDVRPPWCGDCIGVRDEQGKRCSSECTSHLPKPPSTGNGRASAMALSAEAGRQTKARRARSRHI